MAVIKENGVRDGSPSADAAVRIDAAAQQSVGQLSGQRHSDARDGGKAGGNEDRGDGQSHFGAARRLIFVREEVGRGIGKSGVFNNARKAKECKAHQHDA